jgi:hypothetical protein
MLDLNSAQQVRTVSALIQSAGLPKDPIAFTCGLSSAEKASSGESTG